MTTQTSSLRSTVQFIPLFKPPNTMLSVATVKSPENDHGQLRVFCYEITVCLLPCYKDINWQTIIWHQGPTACTMTPLW